MQGLLDRAAALPFGARFLVHPDLFPARAGQGWGELALDLDFAGGPYRFAELSDGQAQALRERFGPLCRAPEPGRAPAVSTRVFRLADVELRRPDLRGGDYVFDRDYGPAGLRLAGVDFLAQVVLEPLGGRLFTPEAGGPPFQCLAENYFRVLVAYRLLALGGVLLHSAGVASRGVAHLFLGPSGAGKSTISRLSRERGRQILSDDLNALCPAHDGFGVLVEKLPFAGDFGRTVTPRDRYPLASLQRLRQGKVNERRPLGAAQAMALLLGCAPIVNADPHRLDRLQDNLATLVARFAAFELTFTLDDDFWPLLEES